MSCLHHTFSFRANLCGFAINIDAKCDGRCVRWLGRVLPGGMLKPHRHGEDTRAAVQRLHCRSASASSMQ